MGQSINITSATYYDKIFRLIQKRIADQIKTPFEIRLWDGHSYRFGKGEPAVKVIVKDRDGLAALSGFDELRICEAYMAGSLDVVGDMLGFVSLRKVLSDSHPLHWLWRRIAPLFIGRVPHDRLAIEIAHHARLRGQAAGDFVMVFVAIGVPYDTADRFRSAMENSGALEHTVLFLNLASDSSTQRLLCPRYALTAAEYLAFVEGKHVLVVMTDMTNYCEALREVSASHGEVPSRKGFPGYLYSDLATLYERAGSLKGMPGSLTQLPILTMPSDDITHPIPDLTGYITEGQIVLDRELDRADIFPPVKVLPSLSRLMKDGTGKGYTHTDHPGLANQLYAAYARAVHVRVLASVVGRDGLSSIDRQFLDLGERFERELVQQQGARTLEQSMAIGWQLLRALPKTELHRLSDRQIAQYIEAESPP